MSLYRTRGIVLRTTRLGEADRIVNLVTENRGKVRAVVKGVRRTASRWGGRMEPLMHVSLMAWNGRELDTVTQAEVVEVFKCVREDLNRMAKAAVMAEVVDRLCHDQSDDPAPYRMLRGALASLDSADSPAIVGAFLWKLLAQEGAAPVLEICAGCGGEGPLRYFDPAAGGATCGSCRGGRPLSPGAADAIAGVLGGRLNSVLRECDSRTASEMERLAAAAMEHHLERRLWSLGVLER